MIKECFTSELLIKMGGLNFVPSYKERNGQCDKSTKDNMYVEKGQAAVLEILNLHHQCDS